MRTNTFIFISTVILLIIALLTYATWLWQNNVSDSAEAINGFISPIIGFISIILLYQTLSKQSDQLEHQAKLLDTENSEKSKANIITQLTLIKELFYGFDWYDAEDTYRKGIHAWEERCLNDLDEYKNIDNKHVSSHPENFLNYIVSNLINTYDLININNSITQEDKIFLFDYYSLHLNLHFKPILTLYQVEIINQGFEKTSTIMKELLVKINILLNASSEIKAIVNANDRIYYSNHSKN